MPMKAKKIKYGNISKKALKMVLGEDYDNGDYTLQREIDRYGEDIIFARYKIEETEYGLHFEFFHAWTKSYTMAIVADLMGQKIVLGLNRNPPNE